MPILLEAQSVIEPKIQELSLECERLAKEKLRPTLEVILVGNNEASLSYIAHKEKFCKKIGASFKLTKLAEDISEYDFLVAVDAMNSNPIVTGCFVQLPVPAQLKHLNITQLIHPMRDVDGFHLNTLIDIYSKNENAILPCTPRGILTLLEAYKISIPSKNIVIIGRSHIVGKPLSLILQNYDATVTLCHSKTKNLDRHTKNADIIVAATGIPGLINKSHIRDDKSQVIIDVGINRVNGKLVGDVAFEEVKDYVYAITPVPGGVGPMTVLSLMENLMITTKNIIEFRKGSSVE